MGIHDNTKFSIHIPYRGLASLANKINNIKRMENPCIDPVPLQGCIQKMGLGGGGNCDFSNCRVGSSVIMSLWQVTWGSVDMFPKEIFEIFTI